MGAIFGMVGGIVIGCQIPGHIRPNIVPEDSLDGFHVLVKAKTQGQSVDHFNDHGILPQHTSPLIVLHTIVSKEGIFQQAVIHGTAGAIHHDHFVFSDTEVDALVGRDQNRVLPFTRP